MKTDPTWALQVAVVEALDTALAPVPVLDHVPQNQPYPYVTVSDVTAAANDDKTAVGMDVTFTLQAWHRAEAASDVRGSYEPKRLLRLAYEALHRGEQLQVAGFAVVTVRQESANYFADADPHTTRGVARVRVSLHATS